MSRLKVIFHVDEMKKWDLTLKNLKNFYNEEPDSDILVLANSEAVEGLKRNTHHESDLELLVGEGLGLLACNNSIKEFKILENDMIRSVEVVASGVVALAKKQQEGYKYIKP